MKTKLNSTMYHKMLLQAEEAKDREMTKLASGVLEALGPTPEEDIVSYNYSELEQDIYGQLWKAAMSVAKYYDIQSADIEKIGQVLEDVSEQLIRQVETAINVKENVVGPLEEKVPGQE
jgi:hypothetical protein